MVAWRRGSVVCPSRSGSDGSGNVAESAQNHVDLLEGLSAPVTVGQIELTMPFEVQIADLRGRPGAALLLVRLHRAPLGVVTMSNLGEPDALSRLAERIWTTLSPEIAQHLASDGAPPVDRLSEHGLDRCPAICRRPRGGDHRGSPLVSVIVATRDRPRLLASCLDSLQAMEYQNFEILVVDNAPANDDTRDLVDSHYSGSVRYLREPVAGLAAAHNHGLRSARGEIVAFTDDDVVVDRNWLDGLVAALRNTDGAGAATGLIMPLELETPAQLLLERHGGFSKGFKRRVFGLERHRPLDRLFPFTVGQIGSGANMAFETDLLRDLGGFDQALGTGTRARGGDDLAGMLSVILAGRQIVFEPSAIVWHRHRRDMDDLASQARGYGVGLGAYLMSAVYAHPSLAFRIATRVAPGWRFAFSPHSRRNAHRFDGWPRALVWQERKGLLVGPLAYLLSRVERRDRLRVR